MKNDPFLIPVTFLVRADKASDIPTLRERVRTFLKKNAGELQIDLDSRLGRGGVFFDEPFKQR